MRNIIERAQAGQSLLVDEHVVAAQHPLPEARPSIDDALVVGRRHLAEVRGNLVCDRLNGYAEPLR